MKRTSRIVPYHVGQAYLVRSVTPYATGRPVAITEQERILEWEDGERRTQDDPGSPGGWGVVSGCVHALVPTPPAPPGPRCQVCDTPGPGLCGPCRARGWKKRGHGAAAYFTRSRTVWVNGRQAPWSPTEARWIARILDGGAP